MEGLSQLLTTSDMLDMTNVNGYSNSHRAYTHDGIITCRKRLSVL